jgi:hypothetical protein
MGTLHYLNRRRFEKLLERSAVTITCDKLRVDGVPDDVRANFRGPAIIFNVGHQLTPPTPMDWNEERIRVGFRANGYNHTAEIPWAAVIRCDALLPPSTGGGGGKQNAA